MKLKFGHKIKTLRMNAGYTQEKLACLCNVSSAAISKWENNQSYPDITTLPILARIFHITIDELLSFEQELTTEQVDVLIQDMLKIFSTSSFSDAFQYCKNLIYIYPNSEMLKLKVAGSWGSILIMLYKQENAEKNCETFTSYAKNLCLSITKSKDLIIRQGACILMSSFYTKDKELQTALDLLQSIPKLSNTTSIECSLYQQLHQNDKAQHLLQSQLYSDCTQIFMNLFSLINIAFKESNIHEAKELLLTMEKFQKVFPTHSSFYTQCFIFYARLKDKENTLRLLKSYIYQLRHTKQVITDTQEFLHKNPCFHSITLKENTHIPKYSDDMIKSIVEECKELNFLKDDKDYLNIYNNLHNF